MKTILGRILSAIVIIILSFDAAINLFAPHLIRKQIEESGFSISQAPELGILIAICTAAYAIPRTAFLGAILVTGFLGGAIATHFRVGEGFSPPVIMSLLLGIATWGALYLRDQRLRMLFL